MQGFFELLARFEVGLSSGWHVDDFARSWIAGRWFGLCILDFQHPESPDLNPVTLDQGLAHRFKQAVYHLQGQIVGAAYGCGDCPGQILLGYGRHGAPLRMVGEKKNSLRAAGFSSRTSGKEAETREDTVRRELGCFFSPQPAICAKRKRANIIRLGEGLG